MPGITKPVYTLHSSIDRRLKFPHLIKGSIGVQVGFDMDFAATSDLFKMARRVGPSGLVLGIDPDPINHERAEKWLNQHRVEQVRLIQKATFDKQEMLEFKLASRPSWNQLSAVPLDDTVPSWRDPILVEADTLDQILAEQNIHPRDIRHINITNNGAEYATLKGMQRLMQETTALSISLIAGRQDPSGIIDGRPDFEVCLEYLRDHGFTARFYRLNQLFWWGFCTKLLLNRKWIYYRPNYGVIFAVKGQSIPWYQSFS